MSVKCWLPGCRRFSRGNLIWINAEIETTFGTAYLPAIAALCDVIAAGRKGAIYALLFRRNAVNLGTTFE
jgi:hypothetical protein